MTNLPIKTHLTSSLTTEAQFQAALGDVYDFINQLATAGVAEEHLLSADRFTPTKGYVVIEPESGAASDNCSGISPSSIGEKVLFLTIKSGKTITLKHNVSGSGKLFLRGTADLIMTEPTQLLCLRYSSSTDTWYESFRNWGVYVPSSTDKSSARTALGLTEIATRTVGVDAGMIPSVDNLGDLAFQDAVGTGLIANNAVTETKIADGAIPVSKLKNGTIDTLVGYATSGAPVNVTMGSGITLLNGVLSAASGSGFSLFKTAGAFTFTVPAGVTQIKGFAIGGGGGGNGISLSNSNPVNGGSGGSSKIGTFCEAYGGSSNQSGGSAVIGSQSAIQLGLTWKGSDGDASNPQVMTGGMPQFMGQTGPGDSASFAPSINYIGQGGKFPGGGAAGFTRQGYTNGRGAGGGGTAMIILTVTPGQVLDITVGAGGTAGSDSYGAGRPGGRGLVLIEW